MNNKDLYYALALIDEDLIDRTETAPSSAVSVKPLRRISLLALSASFVFAVLLIAGNKPHDDPLPFILKAYAEDSDGNCIFKELSLKRDVPVSKMYSARRDLYYFRFSYNRDILSELPAAMSYNDPLHIYIDGEPGIIGACVASTPFDGMIYIGDSSRHVKNENEIVYWILEDKDTYYMTFYSWPAKDSFRYVIDLVIYEKEGGYYAHLISIEKEEFDLNLYSVPQVE